jgi:hypothetical protein
MFTSTVYLQVHPSWQPQFAADVQWHTANESAGGGDDAHEVDAISKNWRVRVIKQHLCAHFQQHCLDSRVMRVNL